MGWVELVLTAVALSMDALAVAITYGVTMPKWDGKIALKLALFFGGFQALMPTIGWLLGSSVRSLIESADHWVAFALLGVLGGKMVWDNLHADAESPRELKTDFRTLLVLAVATSIDALAVGISLAMTQVNVVATALVIGTITFAISLVGVRLGKRVGQGIQHRAGLVGGLILIGIGVKILIEHLLG